MDVNFIHGENDKISYLNMLQNVIARMAGNSAIMKGFAASIMVGIFSMTIIDNIKWFYILIALIPMISFISLDVFYFKMERRYRNLYHLISQPNEYIDHYFAIDLKNKAFDKYRDKINEGTTFRELFFSHCIFGFYGWFLLAGFLFIILA